MLQQCHRYGEQAACLLAAVVVDGRVKCDYSRYIGHTPTQSIIAVRNNVRIIGLFNNPNTLLYLTNSVRQEQNYYRRLIRTHMYSIKRYHFQTP